MDEHDLDGPAHIFDLGVYQQSREEVIVNEGTLGEMLAFLADLPADDHHLLAIGWADKPGYLDRGEAMALAQARGVSVPEQAQASPND
jgi:hypothetical protein